MTAAPTIPVPEAVHGGPVLALEWLYEHVCARFADEGPGNVAQPFGWREVAKHHVGPRIAWVPGDPLGYVGRMGAVRNPGGEPRSLGTLFEQFHVVISNNDESAPENERLQYRATRLLYDYWLRAVMLAPAPVTIETPEWITSKLERRFGTTLRVTATIEAMIPDTGPGGEDWTYAPAGTDAEIDVHELDLDELLTVEIEP